MLLLAPGPALLCASCAALLLLAVLPHTCSSLVLLLLLYYQVPLCCVGCCCFSALLGSGRCSVRLLIRPAHFIINHALYCKSYSFKPNLLVMTEEYRIGVYWRNEKQRKILAYIKMVGRIEASVRKYAIQITAYHDEMRSFYSIFTLDKVTTSTK